MDVVHCLVKAVQQVGCISIDTQALLDHEADPADLSPQRVRCMGSGYGQSCWEKVWQLLAPGVGRLAHRHSDCFLVVHITATVTY